MKVSGEKEYDEERLFIPVTPDRRRGTRDHIYQCRLESFEHLVEHFRSFYTIESHLHGPMTTTQRNQGCIFRPFTLPRRGNSNQARLQSLKEGIGLENTPKNIARLTAKSLVAIARAKQAI